MIAKRWKYHLLKTLLRMNLQFSIILLPLEDISTTVYEGMTIHIQLKTHIHTESSAVKAKPFVMLKHLQLKHEMPPE